MIFKVLIEVVDAHGPHVECKVLSVVSGSQLENRIDTTISNLKADGCRLVRIVDCFNISEPSSTPRNG
ncbi:hypothetical protein [uncultured Duncaniella sp.]|uniref:hypothetical protein n=1 Tax=uncultured Duncaniella sp. TaxID=2768039 RepID=UPI0026774BD5|nr:hypothetical protein [uncultured Duncaniella sp.]